LGSASLALCVGLAIAFAMRARRAGRAGIPTALASLTLFAGCMVGVLAAMHAATIVALRIAAWQSGGSFGYDFRFYALMLLAAVLVAAGVALVRHAPGLSRGEPEARRRTLFTLVALVAVNAPLAPLQAFAIGVGALALALFVLLVAVKKPFRETTPSS
jgi:hypothetical protein